MTDSDVSALLAAVDVCTSAGDDDDIFYTETLIRLRELIPCDDIVFYLLDASEQRTNHLYVSGEGLGREKSVGVTDEPSKVFWQEFWTGGRLCRSDAHR